MITNNRGTLIGCVWSTPTTYLHVFSYNSDADGPTRTPEKSSGMTIGIKNAKGEEKRVAIAGIIPGLELDLFGG